MNSHPGPARHPAVLAIPFLVVGILLAGQVRFGILSLIPVGIGLSLALALSHRSRHPALAAVCVAAILVWAGLFRAECITEDLPPNHVSRLAGADTRVTVIGRIADHPDVRTDRTYLVIDVERIKRSGFVVEATGKTLLKIRKRTPRFQYADRIYYEAYLNKPFTATNPGAFDYRGYLSAKRIYGYSSIASDDNVVVLDRDDAVFSLRGLAAQAREQILGAFDGMADPVNRALLAGFLLGERRGLPAELQDAFRDTGTLHLLVVSGSNVGLLLSFFGFLFLRILRLPRRWGLLPVIPILVFLSFITRNEPSVVRATTMCVIGLMVPLLGRRLNLFNVIAASAVLILLYDPLMLYDIGFLLSFAAVTGIALAVTYVRVPWKTDRWWRRWAVVPFYTVVSTFVAQLFVAPILAYHFYRFSTISFLANLPMIALSVPIAYLGIALGITGPTIPFLAEPIARLLGVVLGWTRDCVQFFAAAPNAATPVVRPSLAVVASFYFLAVVGLTCMGRARRVKILLFGLLVSAVYLVNADTLAQRKPLEMTFLDVPPGRSIFLRTPSGHSYLFDSGAASRGFDSGSRIIAPFLLHEGVQRLDGVFISSPDSVFWGGLPGLLNTIPAERIILPGGSHDLGFIKGLPRDVSIVISGSARTDLGGGVKLDIAVPDNTGGGEGCVAAAFLVRYGDRSIWLGGDSWRRLKPPRIADLVEVYAGPGGDFPPDLQARWVVRTGGSRWDQDRHGESGQTAETDVYSTSIDGAITAISNGKSIRLHPYLER